MYDRLIPEVIRTFSAPGEIERTFLERVREADIRLTRGFRTNGPVPSDRYADPSLRAAYLLRYLGHYSLQLGDVLSALKDTRAEPVLAREELRLVALCGGPCPEAIALAALHQQAGGRRLEVDVLDRNAAHWADCWPISSAIAHAYPEHPEVRIRGLAIDLLQPGLSAAERERLGRVHVFTAMNCLNELIGLGAARVHAGLESRLAALPSGTLVLASDQANYTDCEKGLQLLHGLLLERRTVILLAELNKAGAHHACNGFDEPKRISWMYGPENRNRFRKHTYQIRLAALLR
ncbi:MAG: hypothetical protein QUV07_12880 [Cyanobium sp. CZS 25K]|nr:hypothetical protein [Cyanobium sp. CZS25K]